MSLNKWQKFIELAQPDEDGFSRSVPIEELEDKGLGFGNGGSWCRDDSSLGRIYNIVRHRPGNRIIAVELHGYKKAPISKPIPVRIRKNIKEQRCAILAVGEVECDHKDGRRDDPRLNDSKQVTIHDFQPLSKAANNAKRQHCKECRNTNNRFDAMRLGYSISQWKGGGTYRGSCIGCYWYDPLKFNEEVSKNAKEK